MADIDKFQVGRSIVGGIIGVVIGGMVISMVEMLGYRIFPPPAGLDMSTPEKQVAAMALLKPQHFLSVAVAWFIGATAGGALASAIARYRPLVHSFTVTAFFFAGAVFTVKRLPHPTWFVIVGLSSFLPAAFLGGRLGAGAKDRSVTTND